MEKISEITSRINGILAKSSSPPVQFDCDICRDIGWLLVNDGYKPCECQEAKRYKDILKNSGISEAFLERNFDNYKPRNKSQNEAKKKAMEYAKNFKRIKNEKSSSIAFLAQVGAGKTHLSIAIANKLMESGTGVLYMPYREVITALKQNMVDEEYYQREMSKYKLAPVLLIDDLFKGRITEADINIMYEVINYRYLKGTPIILSCEYGVDKLLDFDEAIGSRIIEMCKGRITEFKGKELNYRLF